MLTKQQVFFQLVDILGQQNLHLRIMPLSEWLKLDTKRLEFVVRAIDIGSYSCSFRIHCHRRGSFDARLATVFRLTRYSKDGSVLLSLDSTDYTGSTGIEELDKSNARKFFDETFENLCRERGLNPSTFPAN